MRKAYKNIISLSVVLIAGLNFIVPAFAQDPFTSIAIGGIGGASGAGLFGSMAGMSGIDIGWPQSGADPLDAMWNELNPDHVYFSGEKHEADPQTDPDDIWDYITVDLGDWLQAQSDFIVAFAQENQVQDNDSGTVSSPTNFDGIPFTRTYYGEKYTDPLDTQYYSYVSGYVTTLVYSHYKATMQKVPGSSSVEIKYYNNDVLFSTSYNSYIDTGNYILLFSTQGNSVYLTIAKANYTQITPSLTNIGTITSGTNIPWTSETVNTHVFDGWENAKVKIPHSISGLNTGWTIPEFTNAINNLWEQGLQGQIVIEDTDQPVPPPPVPTTPLGDVPFDDWIDLWGQGIYQQLENQSDALDFIGSNGEDVVEELESIDSNIDDLNETAESIDTNIGTGIGLLGGIKSAADSAVDFLEGIAEHVEELVEEIVEGTETLIAGILNQIPAVFGVIFGPIKQASSIWHYVVEWIQSISAPMSWIWSMASGTSYNIVLPVYASLAGAVVLAFYKRFGK